jgi:branched-chain amino acid transport system ATP-binding protein
MIQQILATIGVLRDSGTTILMVEQNALAALTLADHGYVIDLGRTTLSGPGKDLLADSRVREAYLG